jgi:hypothetical protein
MSKQQAKSTESIQRLLEERQKVEQWLQRLSIAADGTPEGVRARVESDYRKRLEEVVSELQSYRDELTSTLERHRAQRGELANKERDASEKLAEAELRHAVGEFDEGRFSELRGDIQRSLVEVREGLTGLDAEISGLEEVMELIESGPPEPKADSAPFFDASEEVDAALDAAVSATSGGPGPGEGEAAGTTGALDELEFLRSVTEDESQGPAAARASGQMRMPEDVASGGQPAGLEGKAEPPTGAPEELVIAEEPSHEPKKAAAKTLKCDECGTMNLPTEWYCERCGAELAAL